MSVTQTPARLQFTKMADVRMRRVVWRAFWTSRLVVLLTGMAGVVQIGYPAGEAQILDPLGLTSPFGYFGNLVVSPLARWDSYWYLLIAKTGYAGQELRTAFFPLYPDTIRVVGWLVGSDLIAGVLISLVSFLIALGVLYRLVCLDFSDRVAEVTVLLVAFAPMSFFFSAVYTESLFLALSLGCIYQARQGRWLWAGVLGGFAAATRDTGVVLLLPALILLLYGPRADGEKWAHRWWTSGPAWLRSLSPRYRLSTQILWLLLIPLGLLVYLEYLRARYGMPFGPFRAEKYWFHKSAWPFGGLKQGIVAAWQALRQLLHGPPPPLYFKPTNVFPLTNSVEALQMFSFLVLGAIAFVGGLKRLPAAYSAYTLASFALPLSSPVSTQPLQSLARYELVIFPLFIWGADLLVRRRWTTPVIAVSAVMLGYFTVLFATWRFVA
jgi:hypothetical protein